jgi:hypothetical protein
MMMIPIVLILFIPLVLSVVPPDITYLCDDSSECDTELALCFAAPRSYLLEASLTMGDSAFSIPRCECWSNAYRCYSDCSNKFPFDFDARCLADCPVPILTGVGGPCKPILNSYVGQLLPAVSSSKSIVPMPAMLALVALAAVLMALAG